MQGVKCQCELWWVWECEGSLHTVYTDLHILHHFSAQVPHILTHYNSTFWLWCHMKMFNSNCVIGLQFLIKSQAPHKTQTNVYSFSRVFFSLFSDQAKILAKNRGKGYLSLCGRWHFLHQGFKQNQCLTVSFLVFTEANSQLTVWLVPYCGKLFSAIKHWLCLHVHV